MYLISISEQDVTYISYFSCFLFMNTTFLCIFVLVIFAPALLSVYLHINLQNTFTPNFTCIEFSRLFSFAYYS